MAKVLNDVADIGKLAASARLVVVDYWAAWAEPCRAMNEVFDELARQYTSSSSSERKEEEKEEEEVVFISVEAERFPDLADQHAVTAVPCFVLLLGRTGRVVDRVEGANAAELTQKIAAQVGLLRNGQGHDHGGKEAANSSNSNNGNASKGETLEERLRRLVNSSPCMIFIKGTPTQPRCGFSRQLLEVLNAREVDYRSFDVLSDEQVRQGLKTLYNWPTFPQVYLHGELVGGLDILKEMDAAGEIPTTLPLKTTKKAARDINEYLKELTRRSPVMLFMKGSPGHPQCGFSRQMVHLLDQEGVAFDHFDILSDDEVRQQLKVYSNWPTYPQLYVKGELVGGLDIVREMQENGELHDVLVAK